MKAIKYFLRFKKHGTAIWISHLDMVRTFQRIFMRAGLSIVFSGGVASNSMLRDVIKPLKPIFSQPEFSTDNAMGVAVLAHREA